MPLIGTISGSNGTTTSAASGSFIIAHDPAAVNAIIPNGTVLFVSGAATSIGAELPSITLKGDSFVSGALGTDSYFQMKPVNTLRIPTNTTASYIYTSGSTNDLYFTQYQPGTSFTNTVRLRWLEGTLSTGLLHGGLLTTTNGTTTFNVSEGSGIIIDYNATTTSEPYPTIQRVEWPAQTGISLTYVSTAQITYVAIDSTGAVVQRNTPFNDGDFNDYIVIGRVLHQSGNVTNGVITSPTTAYGVGQASTEFMRTIGPLKISGHTLSVNGTATNPPTNTQFLGLSKTAGDSFVEGRNYTSDPNDPWYIKSTTDTAQTTSKIFREYVNGAGNPVIDNNGGAGFVAVDPTQYNNGGTLTASNSAKFTIQRVYWFPNSVNRAFFVYYGNAEYQSLDAAEAAINSETFTEGANTVGAAILVGYVLVKGNATNLGDAAQARIIQAGLFRGGALGGGGGLGVTLPGGSDTHVQFNDGGTSFGGTSGFRYLKTPETVLATNLVVTGTTAGSLATSGTMQVKDNLGAVVVSLSNAGVISGSGDLRVGGDITGSNMQLSGDVQVVGGDLTTTATTFNLLNTTATTVNFGGTASLFKVGATTGNFEIQNARTIVTGALQVTGSAYIGTQATQVHIVTGSLDISANLTGSNAKLTGDLEVNGGDITTTAASFNLLNATATSINFGGAAQTFNIGASAGLMKIKNPTATIGTDVSLFVSGNIGGTGTSGVTVIGGDLVVSGNIAANGFRSGSIYQYDKKTTSYSMVATDSIIGVSGTAASTIRLPAHSVCVSGQYFIIKDEAGNAGTYNITISGSSSPGTDTIDGQLGILLSNNYGAVTIYRGSDSGKFFIV
jgi:hypothetical protein